MRDGRVRRVGPEHFDVEMDYRGNIRHHVHKVMESDEFPLCLTCWPSGIRRDKLLDCEHAVQIFLRQRARENRPEAGRDRRRRPRHPNYSKARPKVPRHIMAYLYQLLKQATVPAEEDPESQHWKPRDGPRPRGRPPADPMDRMLAALLYATAPRMSLVKFHEETRRLYNDGWLRTRPARNWAINMLAKSWFRDEVSRLIGLSVRPVAQFVHVVAADKSGLTRSHRGHYRDIAWGAKGPPENLASKWDDESQEEKRRLFDGLHILSSTELGVILAAEVFPGNENEVPHLAPLLQAARNHSGCMFDTVLADAGYAHPSLVQRVFDLFAANLITPMKVNSPVSLAGCPKWAELFRMYWEHHGQFLKIYGMRSLVEGMFSAIKRMFLETSKTLGFRQPTGGRSIVSRQSEGLCKVLRYNAERVLHLLLERNLSHSALTEKITPPFQVREPSLAQSRKKAEQVPLWVFD